MDSKSISVLIRQRKGEEGKQGWGVIWEVQSTCFWKRFISFSGRVIAAGWEKSAIHLENNRNFSSSVFPGLINSLHESWGDGSVGTAAAGQAWQPEFDSPQYIFSWTWWESISHAQCFSGKMGAETGEFQESPGQPASLAHTAVDNKGTLTQTRWEVRTDTHVWLSSDLHMHCGIYMHVLIYTTVYTSHTGKGGGKWERAYIIFKTRYIPESVFSPKKEAESVVNISPLS